MPQQNPMDNPGAGHEQYGFGRRLCLALACDSFFWLLLDERRAASLEHPSKSPSIFVLRFNGPCHGVPMLLQKPHACETNTTHRPHRGSTQLWSEKRVLLVGLKRKMGPTDLGFLGSCLVYCLYFTSAPNKIPVLKS